LEMFLVLQLSVLRKQIEKIDNKMYQKHIMKIFHIEHTI